MFSGIVEALSPIIESQFLAPSLLQIKIKKPPAFKDLSQGDSICVDGVCLTLKDQSPTWLQFDVGLETLKVTDWSSSMGCHRKVHLERSLHFGDRVHGHFLSGHVDELGEISESHSYQKEDIWHLKIKLTSHARPYVWAKGSLGVSGVSLTVNHFSEDCVANFCLIPETLARTHLRHLQCGSFINIEYDWMAKAVFNQTQNVLGYNPPNDTKRK